MTTTVQEDLKLQSLDRRFLGRFTEAYYAVRFVYNCRRVPNENDEATAYYDIVDDNDIVPDDTATLKKLCKNYGIEFIENDKGEYWLFSKDQSDADGSAITSTEDDLKEKYGDKVLRSMNDLLNKENEDDD